jgi:hypothetical protein
VEAEPHARLSFFGIAPVGTERLTVRVDGRERELRITPWNGAYRAAGANVV